MRHRPAAVIQSLVRPHARAGVEIRCWLLRRFERIVRPHARAGVEMRRAPVRRAAAREFALMRGRELKSVCRERDGKEYGSPSCEGGS